MCIQKSNETLKSDEIFAKRLKLLRKKRGYSQIDLAKIIDVKQPTICNYEKAICFPSPSKLVAICDQLGTTCDYLLGLTEICSITSLEREQLLLKYDNLSAKEKNYINECINAFYKINKDKS